MSILSRVKISPQQRYDLEDLFAEQAAQRTDEKLYTQKFLSELNLVLSGFAISGLGLNSATVAMTDACLIIPQNTHDFSYWIASPSEPDVVISDADLVDSSRNYVEAQLSTQDGTSLTKAFWDPEANSGAGAEFNQIVNTITDLKLTFVTSTGGFSGSPDRIPIAIIDTDGSGVIKVILDRRNLFGRLAKPNNLDFEYAWGTKSDPAYSLNMTSVSGTFVAGEALTIGGETAKCVAGGTTSITFNEPTGVNFASGGSVVGVTSGATGTINTILESFSGVDKSLNGQKEINDALMTEIKHIKNTRFWWQDAGISLTGIKNFINSIIAPITAGAKVKWDGSLLSITDSSGSPAAADQVAKIRIFGATSQLSLDRQDGTGGSSKIALADGQVLYVQIPTSGDRAFSGIGSGATNYVVVSRAAFVPSDANFWLAYREGTKIFFRGTGELQPNESSEIGDNVPQTLLDNIGFTDEVTPANYTSNIRGTNAESLVSRASVLTDAVGDEQEDRSGYLRSDAPVQWTGTQIIFSTDIILEFINTKGGTLTKHSAPLSASPVTLNDQESLWMLIDRTQVNETCTIHRSSALAIPAQSQANKDVFVLFRRVDVSGVAYLHVPFMKSLMLPGQSVRLGQSGSGSGVQKVTFHDPVSTTLPTGSSVTIDGVAGANGDLVLYSNLGSGNNEVYKLSGVGTAIAWAAQNFFSGALTPSASDEVIISKGTAFAQQIGTFNGTSWKFNSTVRYFNGADYWEQSAMVTSTLADATTNNVFTVAAVGSENIIVDFSLLRAGIKETGTLHLTNDGTIARFTSGGAFTGVTGVSFSADISGGNVRLRFTTTSTGFAATMKYSVKRWSDAAGGPAGLPSYAGGGGGSTPAAGSTNFIQYNTAGTLDANSNFQVDPSDGSINLNGLRQTVLSAPLTILDNQASPANLFTYNAAFNFAMIEYSIVRNGAMRTGWLLVANDGSITSSNGSSVETAVTGIVLSTSISGGNVQVSYTSTSTGFGATFKFSMRKWS